MKKTLIVEDSEVYVMTLKSFIEKAPFLDQPVVCETYSEAIGLLNAENFDMVFLDINLRDVSGLELLKNYPNMPATIITTSHSEYAVESYEIGKAVDFLLKPFTLERFLLAVNRLMAKIQVQNDFIIVKIGRIMQQIKLSEIVYIEASGIYCKIMCVSKVFMVNEFISSLENRLDSRKFIRIHKSYIVNLDIVDSFDAKSINIGKFTLPIGKTFNLNVDELVRIFNRK